MVQILNDEIADTELIATRDEAQYPVMVIKIQEGHRLESESVDRVVVMSGSNLNAGKPAQVATAINLLEVVVVAVWHIKGTDLAAVETERNGVLMTVISLMLVCQKCHMVEVS